MGVATQKEKSTSISVPTTPPSIIQTAVPVGQSCKEVLDTNLKLNLSGENPGVEPREVVQGTRVQNDGAGSTPALRGMLPEQGQRGLHPPSEWSAGVSRLGAELQNSVVLARNTEVGCLVRQQVIETPFPKEGEEVSPRMFTMEDGTECDLATVLNTAGERAITVKGMF